MRKFVISFAMLALLGLMPSLASAQCTSIVVGKKASDDGSVMTAHTCDSNFRTWLTMEPRKVFAPGSVDEIRWGLMHTEEPYDTRDVEVKGSIPAPEKETFRYMNVAYPCMNEKQLAIGETTTEGRQDLRRGDALFLIEELERVALQRCSTARDAIRLMGSLAEEYGFADNGECLTVIDKKEAWFFEIYGTGKSGKKPGALWVAQRIPDDHVGISANVPRIGTVNFSDPDNFMYGSDLRERCKELGLWAGKSPFKFYKMV
jgi:dipeptidase